MSLTLHVDGAAWRAGTRHTLERFGDVIAVVKGNGYGFGRKRLADEAARLGLRRVAVGTVYELDGLPPLTEPPLVLTPALGADAALGEAAVLTVASVDHVRAIAGRRLPVTVKLASSMRRYGVEPGGLAPLLEAIEEAGLTVDGFALHLPFAGDVGGEIGAWLAVLPPSPALAVSHVDADTLRRLRVRHPERRLSVRLGTALWHGDKAALALRADVVDIRPATAASLAGYRLVTLPGEGDGTVVMVGAGTAHGLHPLPDGRSPFHFARQRLTLVEPPHMHTSMVWVPGGAPCPRPGDEVDVQQPLTFVTPDRLREH
jgi:alanine racemase